MKATGAPDCISSISIPASTRAPERRPNNFRIPQLTYADDHPSEDLPAFHFALEVTPAISARNWGDRPFSQSVPGENTGVAPLTKLLRQELYLVGWAKRIVPYRSGRVGRCR